MIADTVTDGPLLFAAGLSIAAGLLSFLSPCVLPLVPGYLSYVTGLAGADLDAAAGADPLGRPVHSGMSTAGSRRVRGRVLAGSGLFVLGFTTVFTLVATATSGAGLLLLDHQVAVQRIVGVLIIVMGLAFLGLIPGLDREFRSRRLPVSGLAGAPLLGAVFALGWLPCTGPTLAAVLGLTLTQGSVGRGVLLAIAYCVGIGVPFVLFGLGLRWMLGLLRVIRRHSRWVTRIGGVMLLVVGVLLVSGLWNDAVIWLRGLLPPGEIPL
jgi:cytochrome c-type biogenesis protein